MKTELIASWKLIIKNGAELYIITTVNGSTIWCTKAQFDSSAETITFKPMKKGDVYTKRDGTQGELQADRNEFQGCGKQIIKKYSSLEILDHLSAKGITPSFQLS